MDGVADLAGAPFTATQIRSTVVDFSVPLVEIVCRFFIKNPEVHPLTENVQMHTSTN